MALGDERGADGFDRLHRDIQPAVETSLEAGERIVQVIPGLTGGLVLTDRRVGTADRGLLGRKVKIAWFPVLNVRALSFHGGLTPRISVDLLGDLEPPRLGSDRSVQIPTSLSGKPDLGGVTIEAIDERLREAQTLARQRGDQLEDPAIAGELRSATRDWQLQSLVRTYERSTKGEALLRAETDVLSLHGYEPFTQSEDGGHVHVGRLLMTGGWSVLAGRRGIRSSGALTVTYRRTEAERSGSPGAGATEQDPSERLRRLAALHADGLLTDDEYARKKEQLLAEL